MIWTAAALTIALVAYACCAAAGRADDYEEMQFQRQSEKVLDLPVDFIVKR